MKSCREGTCKELCQLGVEGCHMPDMGLTWLVGYEGGGKEKRKERED
jgi:hypothetical protein